MPFAIVRNDITKVKADAIVNTANPKPVYGSGVDQAVYQAAGADRLINVRVQIGEIKRGCAVVTPAFALNAKYIIHTVGPVWHGGNRGEFDILRNCYRNSLELAAALGCRSVAFPLIATGVYGFPKDRALAIAADVIQKFLETEDMNVTLVVYDRKSFELSGNAADSIRSYVDSNYVDGSCQRRSMLRRDDRRMLRNAESDAMEMCDEKSGSVFIEEECISKTSVPIPEPVCTGAAPAYDKKVDIDKFIANPEKTFQEKLFEIIDERGLTGPQVYRNYVSKQVYSKIQADRNYHPNKYTAIALCLSLHLDLEQTQDLIGRAGWTLSPSSRADLVVKACILNKEYNVVQINIYLFDRQCPNLQDIK